MAPQHLRIRRGLDVRLPGKPRQSVRAASPVRSVAIAGHDFPGIRLDFRVQAGDRVRAGQTVFVDRKRPAIAFTAPAAGVVAAINLGRRRALDSVVIRIEGEEAEAFPKTDPRDPRALRDLLLASGLWPSFLTRPFGRIPDPDATADAIFVTAIDTNPLAPDPRVAIGLHADAFRRGLDAVALLTEGPVFLCQADGALLATDGAPRLRTILVSGRHPAGLPGTHIHHLAPVGEGRVVWHVGYQDIIAIGRLLETGRPWAERIVALAGPGVRDPALVTVRPGASLDDLLDGELVEGPVRVVSGPILSGRESGFLGRYHTQVTVLRDAAALPEEGFLSRFRRLMQGSSSGAIVPREDFERALPLDILPVPLMRALSVGDIDKAKDLGCLELVEEDLALLSHVCSTGTDYGLLLRDVLDQIEKDG